MTDQEEHEMYAACGGVSLMTGGQRVWDFGFRPSEPSITDAYTTAFDANEDIPEIATAKVFLWQYGRLVNGGKTMPYNWQVTGSCVHGGGHNAAATRVAVEVVNLARPEVFKLPYVGHAYGYSRHLYGWESEGDGSMGDAMARALSEVGATTMDDQNVPKPTFYANCFVFTKQQELKFSAWKNTPQSVRDSAKPHPFKYGSVLTCDEAEKELRRSRPLTWAGDWGGKMQCQYRGTGEDRVLWNGERADTWNHQQSVQGMWIHPTLGRIWCILNQWYYLKNGEAVSVHSEPGSPEQLPGAYWVGDEAMAYQCRTGEVRSIKDFTGFTNGLLNFGNI